MPKRVFITVGEVSGDHHAAELIRALKQIDPQITIEGHGGSAMRAAGATIHHETVGRATMLLRALWRTAEIWKLLRWTRNYYRQSPPDLHICIDSSGMNLHFAKMARSAGVPVLYYIAPQLWASRERRIKSVRRHVTRVACILPFEEAYYRQRGVAATFVGHPLFDALPADRRLSPEPQAFDENDEKPTLPVGSASADAIPTFPFIAPSLRRSVASPIIGLMPGSRKSEVRANWPHMLEVADRIRAIFPQARFETPTTPPTHTLVKELAGNRTALRIEEGAIDAMAPAWDFCIAKSGTTTLHVAAYGVPMIVVYRINPIAWHVVGRWVVKTPSIALVNILAERATIESGVPRHRIVPEIIPWHGSNAPVADLAIDYLRDIEERRRQRADLLNLVKTIDGRGASAHAARIAMEMMGGRAATNQENQIHE